ncbi:MAG TPA: diacylglycerol kinase, partial [Spirochaetota bacterium]|nr:diacylglycerol kinase [Spirochaetota bacterium]
MQERVYRGYSLYSAAHNALHNLTAFYGYAIILAVMLKLLLKLYNSTIYSLRGLRYILQNEASFKLEAAAAVLAAGLGWYLGLEPLQWLVFVLAASLLFITELLNT